MKIALLLPINTSTVDNNGSCTSVLNLATTVPKYTAVYTRVYYLLPGVHTAGPHTTMVYTWYMYSLYGTGQPIPHEP